MKFDLERAKKEGFLYKTNGEYVHATILGILNPGTSLEEILFKYSCGITEYSGSMYVSHITDFHRNHPRELWAVILQGDNGVYAQGNHDSKEAILAYVEKHNFTNVVKVKCIYREGEENEK